jgi:hypothetical protein
VTLNWYMSQLDHCSLGSKFPWATS